ncbi:MAG: phosphoglycerate kinase [Thermoprotei archaeon]|nr:MAG: phosphoglycerate kinase [Thermoprotei archaeon]
MLKEYDLKTLDDVELKDKRVLVRVDINSPVDPKTKKILDYTRIKSHIVTIKELSNKEAKTIIIAHQGRPGDPDFISLKQHAEILSNLLGKEVLFVDDIFGEKARNAIKNLKSGQILMLENVRMWKGERKKLTAEEHSKSELVQSLAPLIDIFVLDEFAAAHRLHASIVGFIPAVKESVIGRVMEKELRVLYKVVEAPERPIVYILGGAKAEDSAELARTVLSEKRADFILTGGLVANLFLFSKGIDIGSPNVEVLEKKGFLELKDEISKLLEEYEDKILLPVDLAVELPDGNREEVKVEELPTSYLIKDVGKKTIEKYCEGIVNAKTVFMNGPMGVFEKPEFAIGTREIFECIARSSAFSLIGGGHTLAAARSLGYSEKVSHMSTGGGALMTFLIKKTLPAIEVLKKYTK